MRKLAILLILLLLVGLALAQTTINGSRSITGYWNAGGALWTIPFTLGTATPATCQLGEVFFDTDAAAGQNVYLCTATDTWTAVGGAGTGDMSTSTYDPGTDGTVDSAASAGTAGALSADGTNCSAGQAPLGVDAAGNAQDCWTPTGSTPNIWSTIDVDGTGDPVPDSTADTLTITAGTGITISGTAASDTVTITNSAPNTNQNIWSTINTSSGTDVAPDGTATTLNLTAGTGITVTGDGTATVTIAATGTGPTTDDAVLVGDGTTNAQKVIPDCDGDNQTLGYDQTTNAFSCGDDDTAAGGGDEVSVDSTATTNPDFQDGGDINFTYNAGVVTAAVKADSVALGTDTTGNYAGSSSEGGSATTAEALAANGANCSSGQAALGVDAAGAAEGCWTPGSSPAGFALVGASDWYTFSADEDGTADVALFDPRTVDSNGDGTVDLDITAGGMAGLHGDGSNAQRFCIGPGGGLSSDPFDYTSLYCFEEDSAVSTGSFYPINSDATGSLGSTPRANLGESSYRWNTTYTKDINASGTITANTVTFSQFGYANTYEGVSPSYWNSNQGHSWQSDNDGDNTAHQLYKWGFGGTATEYMRLDKDSTPEFFLDVDGDDTKDIRFDGDEPAHGESATWDATANAVRWATSGASTQVDIDADGTREISLASTVLSIDPDENGTAELTIDASGNSFSWDINNDGTTEFSYDADATAKNYFCMDPDDNGNCDFMFVDEGTDATPQVGIRFHGATKPTILHDENAKTFVIDNDEDGTYEFNLDGSAAQILLDPNSDGTTDMLLNQTFLQTDQVRYSTESAARMTAANGRMHMCGGNTFAPTASAGACMSLGGATGTYATTIYFDPDGDGTSESNISSTGAYSGSAAQLATDPTGCTNQFVTDMAAAGALTCNSVTGGYVTDGSLLAADLTWQSTATRSAGQGIVVGSDTTKFDVVTLMTESSSNTLTNKTYDAAGTGNVFTLEDGTGVSAASAGQIKIDTTANQLVYYGGAAKVYDPRQTLAATLMAPADADTPLIFKAPYGMTITDIDCIVGAATSAVIDVQECTSAGASCATVDATITCDTDGAADDGTLSNGSIDSGDWIKLDIGTVTGTVGFVSVTITYTITQE